MQISVKEVNNMRCAIVQSTEPIINDSQSALDIMMSIRYEDNCDCIVVNKEAFAEQFFVLSSGIAGEILQKIVNYHFQLAIVGDFSEITSKPLQDFIYESNQGKTIFFVADTDEALDKLKNR
ncbi:DUF4180 domain-containing protein [Culicoidibacter larvae]|uniref:DUF4180 domain-containing protein n=1 Tax=Culicoidibacter larvae TaxID=2579976 RepID=A0A5R8Q9M3_9FIRM|nr:DUF4180 domain-containing protein [Culicoidibacter larvae]TLG72547.1 DUF4180 domain-containing protein [Culicoidibacter larvae]